VLVNKELLTCKVPVNKELLIGTVPVNNFYHNLNWGEQLGADNGRLIKCSPADLLGSTGLVAIVCIECIHG